MNAPGEHWSGDYLDGADWWQQMDNEAQRYQEELRDRAILALLRADDPDRAQLDDQQRQLTTNPTEQDDNHEIPSQGKQ